MGLARSSQWWYLNSIVGMPIKPSQFAALQITEDESFCEALKKLLKLSVYVWKHIAWKYESQGVLSLEYKAQVCAIECPSSTDEGSTTSGNPPT